MAQAGMLPLSALAVPVFTQMLDALSALLDKAEAFAAERKIEPKAILEARLAPDMFTFTRQVQIAADFAKGASARLAGVDVPSYADDEASFADLKARIAKTLAFIRGLDSAAIDAGATRTITLKLRSGELNFQGQPYLIHFATPNFYFHLSMAYALLRELGLPIGKADFMGKAP